MVERRGKRERKSGKGERGKRRTKGVGGLKKWRKKKKKKSWEWKRIGERRRKKCEGNEKWEKRRRGEEDKRKRRRGEEDKRKRRGSARERVAQRGKKKRRRKRRLQSRLACFGQQWRTGGAAGLCTAPTDPPRELAWTQSECEQPRPAQPAAPPDARTHAQRGSLSCAL